MIVVAILTYLVTFSLMEQNIWASTWVAFTFLEIAYLRYYLSYSTIPTNMRALWYWAAIGLPVYAVWKVYDNRCLLGERRIVESRWSIHVAELSGIHIA
jgi:hypothetical protein